MRGQHGNLHLPWENAAPMHYTLLK